METIKVLPILLDNAPIMHQIKIEDVLSHMSPPQPPVAVDPLVEGVRTVEGGGAGRSDAAGGAELRSVRVGVVY